jgi:hypothetical protein
MDLLCYDDLDEFGRELDDPLAELEQDVVHMLLESYRSNPDAPERSIGLLDALSGATNPGLRHLIETKLEQDDRIDAAEATLTAEPGNVVRIELRLQVNQQELGMSFELDGLGNVRRTTS